MEGISTDEINASYFYNGNETIWPHNQDRLSSNYQNLQDSNFPYVDLRCIHSNSTTDIEETSMDSPDVHQSTMAVGKGQFLENYYLDDSLKESCTNDISEFHIEYLPQQSNEKIITLPVEYLSQQSNEKIITLPVEYLPQQSNEKIITPPVEHSFQRQEGIQQNENSAGNLFNCCLDFSDLYDETYSFWPTCFDDNSTRVGECDSLPENTDDPPVTPIIMESYRNPETVNSFGAETLFATLQNYQLETTLPIFNSFDKSTYQEVSDFPLESSQFTVCDLEPPANCLPTISSTFSITSMDDSKCASKDDSIMYYQPNNDNFSSHQIIDSNQEILPLRTPNENLYDLTVEKVSTFETPNPPSKFNHGQRINRTSSKDVVHQNPKKIVIPISTSENYVLNTGNNPNCYLLTAGGSQFLVINNDQKSKNFPCNKWTSSGSPVVGPTLDAEAGLFSVPRNKGQRSSPPDSNKEIPNAFNSVAFRSSLPCHALNALQSQEKSIYLTKSVNTNDLVNNGYSSGEPLITAQQIFARQDRRKTVRELLQEQRKTTKPTSNRLKMTLVNARTSTKHKSSLSTSKKPSILMLYPEKRETSKKNLFSVNSLGAARKLAVDKLISQTTGNSEATSWMESSDLCISLPKRNEVDTEPVSDIVELQTFQPTQINNNEFEPKYYDLLQLEIGNFKSQVTEGEKSQSKFKVLFLERQFVYEFRSEQVEKRFVCIVVPFKSVVAMSCEMDTLKFRVNAQPKIYLESKAQSKASIENIHVFDTSRLVDVTNGEATRCRTHIITLGKQEVEKLKSTVCKFDSRFQILLWTDFEDADSSTLSEADPTEKEEIKRRKKNSRSVIRQPPKVNIEELKGEDDCCQVCSCRISCRSFRCSCVKAAQKCSSGRSLCICTDCDNPLNILESFGISSDLAVQDSCLFQNIYQMNNLRQYLYQELRMPCCSSIATLQACIPFRVLCPNTDCAESVEYSWCRGVLNCPQRNPRNHCSICGRCSFSSAKHCQKCNICYSTKPKTSSCPKCATKEEWLPEEPLIKAEFCLPDSTT